MAEDWKGIDLDEDLESELNNKEFTDATDADFEDLDEHKRKFKLPSLNLGEVVDFFKKPLHAIVSGIALLLIIAGGFLLFGRGQKNTTPVSNTGTGNSSVTKKEGLSKSAYDIFTNGIKEALNANDVKNKVASDWRAATIKYGETNDLEGFKKTLVEVNNTRKKALEAIPEDDYQINRYMIETLNVQRDYLNKAYGVKTSEEATNVYNEWRNKVNTERDNRYIEILIAELEKAGIPYHKSEDDGKLSVTF